MNGYKDDPLQINDNQSDPLQPITNPVEPDPIPKPSNQSPLQYRSVKSISHESHLDKYVKERTHTLRLTQEFNEKFFNQTRKSIEITNLSIMKDDIKNYRSLTELQLTQLETFTEAEKIEIIKTYNIMFESLENVL
jgi:hypothetical protein